MYPLMSKPPAKDGDWEREDLLAGSKPKVNFQMQNFGRSCGKLIVCIRKHYFWELADQSWCWEMMEREEKREIIEKHETRKSLGFG